MQNLVAQRRGVTEKKMFGSVVFLLHGNMLVGVWKQSLIARLGPEQAAIALQEPHVVKFDVTGKPMKGWVMVEPDGIENDSPLQRWIDLAWSFVENLPSK